MRTVDSRCSVALQPCLFGISMLLVLCATACSRRDVNALNSFAQQGQQTVFELTDKNGGSWKIHTVKTIGVTGYFVINSKGQIDIIAATLGDGASANRAYVFVDSSEKEEALAVLDTKFLSGLTNASDDYKKWLGKNAVLTYGGVQETRRFDVQRGALGRSNIRVQNGEIVGQEPFPSCECVSLFGNVPCARMGHPLEECFQALCRLVNCISGVANGQRPNCTAEGSDAKEKCDQAAAAGT